MTVFLITCQYDSEKGAEMMRLYGIYKIKAKHEQFIVGREHLLYELLKGNVQHKKRVQEVRYLCEPIEETMIEEVILSKLGESFESIHVQNNRYELTHAVKGTIYLTVSSHALTVHCVGSRMLDLDLFVALSEVDGRFFAVMEGENEWGWLKPMKHTKEKLKSPTVLR